METEKKKHRCVGGPLNGHKFDVTSPVAKIDYVTGFYLRSSMKEEGVILWVWHTDDEDADPAITPH